MLGILHNKNVLNFFTEGLFLIISLIKKVQMVQNLPLIGGKYFTLFFFDLDRLQHQKDGKFLL